MRKAGNLRNYKKIKNAVDDDFYMSWLGNERLADKVKNLPAKKLNFITERAKQTIDKTYLLLKVEEKYKYYVNLYLLYDMCCLYFNLENGLKKYLEQTLENREEFQATYRDIEKILGYEPREEDEIDREITFINMLLLRIKYAREHIDVIYSLNKNFEAEDKKLRTMIKSSLTRIEKPIRTIIGYIEELYTEETA